MQQQPVSNLLSSAAESKETQTPLIEQLRTVEKITIYLCRTLDFNELETIPSDLFKRHKLYDL